MIGEGWPVCNSGLVRNALRSPLCLRCRVLGRIMVSLLSKQALQVDHAALRVRMLGPQHALPRFQAHAVPWLRLPHAVPAHRAGC